MGGKRPANEYAFAPMYRIRKVEKRSVGVLRLANGLGQPRARLGLGYGLQGPESG